MDEVFGTRTAREPLAPIGQFTEIYLATSEGLDLVLAWQGDYLVEFVTAASKDRKQVKDLTVAVLTAIAASTPPTPTTVPTAPTVPAAPTDPTATTTTSTTTTSTTTSTTTTTLAPKQV